MMAGKEREECETHSHWWYKDRRTIYISFAQFIPIYVGLAQACHDCVKFSFKSSLLLGLLLTLYQPSRIFINGFSAAGPGLSQVSPVSSGKWLSTICLILLIQLGDSCFFPITPFTLLVILSCLVNAIQQHFLQSFFSMRIESSRWQASLHRET